MNFAERYKTGTAAEQIVFRDLEERGWNVEPGPRHYLSAGLNRVITEYRDSHSAPCFFRWSPDWFVWQRDLRTPSNLYFVDVKSGGYHIERRALMSYEVWANQLNMPGVVVFEVNGELLASSPGKLALNTRDHFGVDADRTPFFEIDVRKLSPMERFFGAKKP